MQADQIDKIVLLNFGGIGDEILFSPVIETVRQACPEAHLTLILEARSQRVKELLPQIDSILPLDLGQLSRPQLFFKLLKILRGGQFDVVISSGSSPFIALLLGLSSIPIRIGFDSGKLAHRLLSHPAPLDRQVYAGDMYYSLAQAFLTAVESAVPPMSPVIPRLSAPEGAKDKARAWLRPIRKRKEGDPVRIMLHPGVSRMSIEKNILKAWPVTHWQALISQMLADYPQVELYLLGGPDDAETIESLADACQDLPEKHQARFFNLYGKTTSLKDLAGIFSWADAVVSVDSAPLHLALGLNLPVVAIFSPTDPKKLVPDVPYVRVAARTDLDCRPCLWDVRKTSCEAPVCLDVPVAEVRDALVSLLALEKSAAKEEQLVAPSGTEDEL